MPRSRRAVGDDAEERAVRHLLGQGYTVVTRNYTVRGGEIDVVAMDGETVVFVEVKSRMDAHPEDALTPRKAGRLRVAARAYLTTMGIPDHPHRFDLVAIEGDDLRHHVAVELG